MKLPLCRAVVLSGIISCAAGAAQAQPNVERIRVAVVRSDPQVTLKIYGPFKIVETKTGGSIQEGRRLPQLAVRAVSGGLAFGEQVIPYSGVLVEPERDAAITLNGRRLRGIIEIVRQQDLTLLVINHIELEDYLRGVLSKEAPDYWPREALKAVAIAARTYALYQRLTKEPAPYDVTGDVMSQDYGGRTGEKWATSRAVKATEDLILLYQGKLFPTFYHSTCGGLTEHARVMGPFDLPPLHGGIACQFCSASPFYTWQRRFSKADVAWILRNSPYHAIGAIADMQVTKRTATGRAEDITITGAARTVKLSGYDFRSLFGFERIRSLSISIAPFGDGFAIEGHGWGHGVGLCQWGASELARRGLTAREILAYYYPQAELAQLQDIGNQPIRVIGGN